MNAHPREVVFTGSGTEANNLAIKGAVSFLQKNGRHLITSSIEHPAVLKTCQYLEKLGFRVTYVPVDRYGVVDPEEVRKSITPETILITLMHSNNEVGTIQPVQEIGQIARTHGILFHTDAIQSIGKIPVDVRSLGVDFLSISAHKIYGLKGVGALFIKEGTLIEPLHHGGHHELNRRAGTENVSGIVGVGKASELAFEELLRTPERAKPLRDYFWEKIQQGIDHVRLNGHPTKRLPNTLNVTFEFIEGESLVINLDLFGIATSTGSACTSGALEPSHVLLAMGVPALQAQGSLRISIGRDTTQEEVDQTVEALKETVHRLRSMSPFYADLKVKRR
jgi:cysteine desulfurase